MLHVLKRNFSFPLLQAREEFHAQLAAQRRSLQQPLQSPDLLDDSELATDDRDLDADVTGEFMVKRLECKWKNIQWLC